MSTHPDYAVEGYNVVRPEYDGPYLDEVDFDPRLDFAAGGNAEEAEKVVKETNRRRGIRRDAFEKAEKARDEERKAARNQKASKDDVQLGAPKHTVELSDDDYKSPTTVIAEEEQKLREETAENEKRANAPKSSPNSKAATGTNKTTAPNPKKKVTVK